MSATNTTSGTATAAPTATVMVVDDDPAVRRSVSRLVRSAGYSVHAFETPNEFLDHPMPDGPSCVLLDMCMVGMTGLQVQDQLLLRERRVPVIFLSGQATVPDAAIGFKHGAEDFLEKPVRPKALLEAVGHAIERDRVQSSRRDERDGLRRRFDTLTHREQDVMRLVVSGRMNKEAAVVLDISEKTIKVHRARVMEKMRVTSFAALVLVAERMALTPSSAELTTEAPPRWLY